MTVALKLVTLSINLRKSNMPKFTFIAEHDDDTTTAVTFEKEQLDEVLDQFKFFLSGVSYIIDPHSRLDFVNDD